MIYKKNARRALFVSMISLILCCAMLVGTTFAWFTDSVTSGKNQIVAGNLDVELEYKKVVNGTATEWATLEGVSDAFDPNALWEPGRVEVVYLKVSNLGTLALKYQLGVNVHSETSGVNVDEEAFNLSDYLVFKVVEMEDPFTVYSDREAVQIAAGTELGLEAYSGDGKELDPKGGSNAEDYVALIVYMPETVGNKANYRGTEIPRIELGVVLNATQLEHEFDSFGNDYDVAATYPASSGAEVAPDTTEATVITVGEIMVTIPAGSAGGFYKVDVTDKEVQSNSVTYDISLTRDGVKVEPQEGVMYPVAIQLERLLDIQKLLHNDEEITAYEYDALTGVLTFKTNSFSPFKVEFERVGEGVEFDKDGNLISGTFVGTNPAELDPSLAMEDSKYIAISYTRNGQTCYVISERATTVILSASDTVYTPVNSNYTAKIASGKLYAEISALQNNVHSTVYLLPGTYNEATTIYVYSSMDIIGLGDKDAVKVIKSSSSDSNRHLFNCTGSKADYIEVTIRNLYLDATAKTTGGKDNAAVQSIRKSKVKCYDLTIVKGTGWDDVAFYVNGNNAVDGVKYTAYLYAENCSLNTTRSFGVVSTAGTYKFYHSGLTYGGTSYTNNSGSIKNQTMASNDWWN